MTNSEKEFEAWLEKEIPAINLIGREAAFACWQAAWGKAFQLASEACEDYDDGWFYSEKIKERGVE